MQNDPFGQAIKEYLEKGKAPAINVNSNYTENESISTSYLFRDENEMPDIEKEALKRCHGKILDVGAAAGCHTLVLQKKGLNVTALEKSALAAETMKKRGILKVINTDILEYNEQKFTTILLLMNGAGIGKTLAGLKKLLVHLKSLLQDNGQILIDSSDIKYLFQEEDGSFWIDLNSNRYYGEMTYEISFREWHEKFDWLFIDFQRLSKLANHAGLHCKLIKEGAHYNYLAQLSI